MICHAIHETTDAKDVKETCACKNCLNSRESHNAIAMCKIDVISKKDAQM